MGWLKAAWQWVRKLPVARYIRPLWKGLLKEAVQVAGDEVQSGAIAALETGICDIAKRVNPLIDSGQSRLAKLMQKLPLPDHIEEAFWRVFRDEVDQLQAKIEKAACAGSMGAVKDALNAAFDDFQLRLKARIDAL